MKRNLLLYISIFFSPLKYFALRYIDDQEIVCDIIQDLFLKLWNTHQKFENHIAAKVFLYRATRNACLNKIRDIENHNRIQQKIEITDTEESFLNHIIEAEIFNIVKNGFNQLPPPIRKVYEMSLEDMTHAEIAEVLKISINTVKKYKNTAHHVLREQFKNLFMLIAALS